MSVLNINIADSNVQKSIKFLYNQYRDILIQNWLFRNKWNPKYSVFSKDWITNLIEIKSELFPCLKKIDIFGNDIYFIFSFNNTKYTFNSKNRQFNNWIPIVIYLLLDATTQNFDNITEVFDKLNNTVEISEDGKCLIWNTNIFSVSLDERLTIYNKLSNTNSIPAMTTYSMSNNLNWYVEIEDRIKEDLQLADKTTNKSRDARVQDEILRHLRIVDIPLTTLSNTQYVGFYFRIMQDVLEQLDPSLLLKSHAEAYFNRLLVRLAPCIADELQGTAINSYDWVSQTRIQIGNFNDKTHIYYTVPIELLLNTNAGRKYLKPKLSERLTIYNKPQTVNSSSGSQVSKKVLDSILQPWATDIIECLEDICDVDYVTVKSINTISLVGNSNLSGVKFVFDVSHNLNDTGKQVSLIMNLMTDLCYSIAGGLNLDWVAYEAGFTYNTPAAAKPAKIQNSPYSDINNHFEYDVTNPRKDLMQITLILSETALEESSYGNKYILKIKQKRGY